MACPLALIRAVFASLAAFSLVVSLLDCAGAQKSAAPTQLSQMEAAEAATEPPALPIDAAQLAQAADKLKAAPVGTWTWIDVPGARCGNGAPTGLGFNRAASSNNLLIFMQGGGACSDAQSCYVRNMATYVAEGYGAAQFAADAPLLGSFVLTNRASPGNPLANAHLAYIPYCTGDVHTGNNIVTYPGAPQATYHLGATKTQLSAAVLAAALGDVDRVVLAGSSAGAFGVVVNYGLVQALFATHRVDIISDSGESPLVPPSSPAWKSLMPIRCAACDHNRYGSYLPAYATAYPSSRFAALSFETDPVLPRYMGLTPTAFTQTISGYFADINKLKNARTFLAPGSNHVVLNRVGITSGSQSLVVFLSSMLSDDETWHSAP